LRHVGPEGLQAAPVGAKAGNGGVAVGGGGGSTIGGGSTSSYTESNARLLEVIFNTLLDACVGIRDLDRMAKVFEMMDEFGVGVSAVTFGTLIKAFGQAGQLDNCHEVWQRMCGMGIAPTVVTFGCFIDACVRGGNMVVAEEAFFSMAERGIRPNGIIYASMIRGYTQARQPACALRLYRAMRNEGIDATTATFNAVLNALAVQLSDAAILQEVIDDMHEAQVPPDVFTYSILIKASCNAGHLDSALALLEQLRKHGHGPDETSLNTLLLACSKADRVKDAEHVFESMRALGVQPTDVTASILVKMYGKAKLLDKAAAVSLCMEREYGRKPNLYVYTCLIQACVQNKQVRRSWHIFNEMLRAGVMPDAITYGTMIHGCVYANKLDLAMTLVRHALMLPTPTEAAMKRGTGPLVLEELQVRRRIQLQTEVVRVLHAALRRKHQLGLAAELATAVALNEESEKPD